MLADTACLHQETYEIILYRYLIMVFFRKIYWFRFKMDICIPDLILNIISSPAPVDFKIANTMPIIIHQEDNSIQIPFAVLISHYKYQLDKWHFWQMVTMYNERTSKNNFANYHQSFCLYVIWWDKCYKSLNHFMHPTVHEYNWKTMSHKIFNLS